MLKSFSVVVFLLLVASPALTMQKDSPAPPTLDAKAEDQI